MQTGPLFKRWLGDIRFWIILMFVVRLYGITNPPLETGHNWRQSLTCMIARNFYENGPDILHPVIDMDGTRSGVIGSEFPLFNYAIFLVAKVFGYDHWYGRLLNLIISSIGLFYFYKIILKYFNASVAFSATLLLLSSIWFAFSRKIMPDTFSVSLVIIGLYYLSNYLDRKSLRDLILYFVFCLVGILCKIPALFLLSFLVIPMLHSGITLDKKIRVGIVTSLMLGIVFGWYFYHVPNIIANGGFQLYFPKSFSEGINEIIPLWPQVLEKFYFSGLSSYLAFACFLGGILVLIKSGRKLLGAGLLTAFFIFVLFIIKTGAVFPLHNYYIIPFVPVMALVAGIGIASVPKKVQIILLCLIAIEGIANQQHDFFIKDNEKYKLTLEPIMDQFVGKDELIVINGNGSPQQMYFSHRKGWIVSSEELADSQIAEKLALKGAMFLVVDKRNFGKQISHYSKVYDGTDYAIFNLQLSENSK